MNKAGGKLALFFVICACFVAVFMGFNSKALAFDLFGPTCSGNNVKGGNGQASDVCTSDNSSTNDNYKNNAVLNDINIAANIVASLTGVFAVIMIIVGGFSMVTSGGSSEKVQGARRRIVNASIGLVVVALAWTITRFITDKLL